MTKKLLVKVLSSLEDIRQTQKLHYSMIQNILNIYELIWTVLRFMQNYVNAVQTLFYDTGLLTVHGVLTTPQTSSSETV